FRLNRLRQSLVRPPALADDRPAREAGKVAGSLPSALLLVSDSSRSSACCFSLGEGALPNARFQARCTQLPGSVPVSFTNRPANSRACSKATLLFKNQSACGATVVTSRSGQLTALSGLSNACSIGYVKLRRFRM